MSTLHPPDRKLIIVITISQDPSLHKVLCPQAELRCSDRQCTESLGVWITCFVREDSWDRAC